MSKQVQAAYIVAASRTPIGRSGRGYFKNTRSDDLLVTAAANPQEHGGRIGPVACGAWQSEVAAPFFSLKPGEVFPLPVPSRQGFHVLLMERIRPGALRAFAEVEHEVGRRLAHRSRLAAARRHLERLAEDHGWSAARP